MPRSEPQIRHENLHPDDARTSSPTRPRRGGRMSAALRCAKKTARRAIFPKHEAKKRQHHNQHRAYRTEGTPREKKKKAKSKCQPGGDSDLSVPCRRVRSPTVQNGIGAGREAGPGFGSRGGGGGGESVGGVGGREGGLGVVAGEPDQILQAKLTPHAAKTSANHGMWYPLKRRVGRGSVRRAVARAQGRFWGYQPTGITSWASSVAQAEIVASSKNPLARPVPPGGGAWS
jgi:hypothetical protein